MKIVVLDGYTLNPGDNPWDELAMLGELSVYDRTPPGQILERAHNADILLTNKTPLTAESLHRLPRLKYISVLATGYNVVDIAAAAQQGISVSNVPVYGTNSVAQFVFALLLELCHQVGKHDQAVKSGRWLNCPDFCFWDSPLIELAGLTMGIVGLGRIGRQVAHLAHAFGMRVLAFDARPSALPSDPPFEWTELTTLCRAADVISLHCPLMPETQGMINPALIELMKPTALLINTSRGPLIHEHSLAAALHAGRLAGAAIDVVAIEPIQPENPLLTAPRCLITPHIAWATLAARRRLMQATVQNVAEFLAGHPINVVNRN